MSQSRQRVTVWGAVTLVALAALWLLSRGSEKAAGDGAPKLTPQPPSGSAKGVAVTPPPQAAQNFVAPTASAQPSAEPPKTLWESRLARAQRTLDEYLAANKYPPWARPLGEHPDQQVPMQKASQQFPFKTKAGPKRGDLKVVIDQDMLSMHSRETVTMTVRCEDANGPVPTVVSGARLTGVLPPRPNESAPVAFHDDGKDGDTAAGDQTWTGKLRPADTSFANYHGHFSIQVDVTCKGIDGQTDFAVVNTPEAPAAFTGVYREAIEKGSLAIYAGVTIAKAGHYVIRARLEDDAGKGIALLEFIDDVAVGLPEIRLEAFGKLIRDANPKFPLRMRDLEGRRLYEGDPGHEDLDMKLGVQHTTKVYPLDTFSEAEWQSEEKDRHVKEFTKDVNEAKQKVDDEKSGKVPVEQLPGGAGK